jgi:hypothetical protein
VDYYSGQSLTQARFIDVDHLVPLREAHKSGAVAWSGDQKTKFANDPENLVVTHRSFNRTKGPQGIGTWLPSKRDIACRYARDYLKVKKRYELETWNDERNSMADACEKKLEPTAQSNSLASTK